MLEDFKQYMENKFNEFEKYGTAKEAIYLQEKIEQHLNHNNYPHFFTGKLDSRIVFVHLNPKEQDTDSNIFGGTRRFESFDEYFDFYERYGTYMYKNPQSYLKSSFDQKQLKLLKALGIMNFLDESIDKKHKIRNRNLAISIDQKLQLELIPYGSDNLKSISNKKIQYLKGYINRILDLIISVERDYIFFCGKVHIGLLKDYIVSNTEYKIEVKTKDGKNTSSYYHNIELNYNGKQIKAGILRTYPKQGFDGNLIVQYGKKVIDLYINR